MDAIMNFIKDYEILPIIAIIISLMAFIHAKRADKSRIKLKIEQKQAELDALDSIHFHIDMTSAGNSMTRRTVLQKEIEALKKKL